MKSCCGKYYAGAAIGTFLSTIYAGCWSSLGFEKRIRGSHHTFRKTGVREKINLQREGSNAKAYQVKQVRGIILKYRLAKEE